MGLFKKKPQTIKFWCITDKNNNNHFYTFTNTYAQVLEYLFKLYVYQNKYEHYVQWCEFRGLDKSKDESVFEYVSSLEVNLSEHYNIGRIEYTQENLASLFRIYNGCVPLNCSFETNFERENYLELIKNEKLKSE